MKRLSLTLMLIITLVFAFSVDAKNLSKKPINVRKAQMERAPGVFDAAEYSKTMRSLSDWLKSEAAPLSTQSVITVNVTSEDLESIENYQCETCGDATSQTFKERVGVVKGVGAGMDFSNLNRRALRKGQYGLGSVQAADDGGFVWTVLAESPTAAAMRIHFTDVSLPSNAALYVYSEKGRAFGPYTAADGEFWSHTIFGSQAYVQLRFFGEPSESDLENLRFNIADIGHLGAKFLLPLIQEPEIRGDVIDRTEEFCDFNADCVVNVNCQSASAVNTARDAIGHMQWVSGAWIYICTGGLIADTDTSTQIPYFLTANHCISKSRAAGSLEVFFFFDVNCGGSCYDPDGVVPSTLGSSIVATSKDSDVTLLQLDEPAPSGAAFMGWNNSPVAFTDGYNMYRISHPGGAPQAYSQSDVEANPAVTCSSLAQGNFIYSTDQVGATEGGSSGSPIVNSSGEIVGQLYGVCGTNIDDVCDAVNNYTIDGAFAVSYTLLAPYLDAGGGPGGSELHVDSIVLSTKSKGKKTDYIANVTIVDENGAPVEGAVVYGEFDGTSANGTTGADGEATLKVQITSGSIAQFCVTNVVLSGYTYVAPSSPCQNF